MEENIGEFSNSDHLEEKWNMNIKKFVNLGENWLAIDFPNSPMLFLPICFAKNYILKKNW